jgi:hypothetical protein
MWKRLLVVALLAWGAHSWWSARAVSHGPGVVAAEVPEQGSLDSEATFDYKGYKITRLASFALEARVLSRADYHLGREAELSPTDLALGWGRMSDETVLHNIDISQGNRFYFWRVEEFPIPQREIQTSSANMHLIPADNAVARQLDKVRKGAVVQLHGYLIRAEAGDGWRWVSSLSREDAGAGACEVVWVEGLTIL